MNIAVCFMVFPLSFFQFLCYIIFSKKLVYDVETAVYSFLFSTSSQVAHVQVIFWPFMMSTHVSISFIFSNMEHRDYIHNSVI